MVTIGGTGVMVLGALLAAALAALVALLVRRRLGPVHAVLVAGLLWSLLVIAVVTLVPAQWGTGIVPAETRSPTCSWDYGGPAPEGFWVLGGTQRTLNTLLFVPAGAFGVLAFAGWWAWRWIPLGFAGLAAYSIGIETGQLALARIDRACDVTDVVDNVTGAAIGVVIGLLLAAVLRPWRRY
ncbi:VanZ family protein [Nocardioides gansuensis]|uniref:VanZ family protein n=1 Tax=Nocardioides gansuensis TaxID=2138300 RepID=UPI00105800E4|nr:VanZ family protein [Nocardioides gansuensis]